MTPATGAAPGRTLAEIEAELVKANAEYDYWRKRREKCHARWLDTTKKACSALVRVDDLETELVRATRPTPAGLDAAGGTTHE